MLVATGLEAPEGVAVDALGNLYLPTPTTTPSRRPRPATWNWYPLRRPSLLGR